MTTIAKAKMPGACRSGGDSRGSLVHLIENPDARPLVLLGPALCGALPNHDWVDTLPTDEQTCPRCQRKLEKMQAAGDRDITP
jgi:hypothetical protein